MDSSSSDVEMKETLTGESLRQPVRTFRDHKTKDVSQQSITHLSDTSRINRGESLILNIVANPV
jgi:hypothetical protein